MRRISLNQRLANNAASTDTVEVALFSFDHPTLDAPIRLSTDSTERLSTEPLAYGTRSSWLDANPVTEPYLFVIASAMVPDDLEDSPGPAEFVLDNVDQNMVAVLRSITNRADVHIASVLAATPDVVEVEWRNLKLVGADGDAARISLKISRNPIELERVPMDSFTKSRFPGLFAG